MLTAISLYTGAGGLDLGFEAAGFHTVACIDIDPDARSTILQNRPWWGLLDQGDIHRLTPRQVLRSAKLRSRELDVLLAGPPCQPFSKAALWSKGHTGGLADPRSRTLAAIFDFVEVAQPRALLIENVPGLISHRNALEFFNKRIDNINRARRTSYNLEIIKLNAVDYGVPQQRERTFVIAFRDGNKFEPPPKTHFLEPTPGKSRPMQPRHRTAWDAIGDLVDADWTEDLVIRGKWRELLPSIPEGSNYLYHTARGAGIELFGWRARYWTFLLKLSKRKPSWTIHAEPGPSTGPFHWNNRKLSIRELCRLQTFPDTYEIAGPYRAARRQIGNAVPPALGEAVARQIRACLEGTATYRVSVLAAPERPNCPPAEPAIEPSQFFVNLVRSYPEHPGPGLGPGALGRSRGQIKRYSK